MEIVLEVGDKLGKAWNNISPELKAEYSVKLIAVLEEIQPKESELTAEQLAFLAEDAKGEPYEWWNDEEMMAELDQIEADMKSGKDKGFTLEESRAQLMARLKKNG